MFSVPEQLDATGFTIRAYRRGDGAALQSAVVESYDHLRPWMPWATANQTVEEAETLCRRFAATYLSKNDYVLGIWRDEQLLGGTGFHLRVGPIEARGAEIGMWIRGGEANKGLGTRVLAAMLKWGFTEWEWERLVWRCDARNRASARLAEKNGMRLEGTFLQDVLDVEGIRRDTHSFAILRPEWKANFSPNA